MNFWEKGVDSHHVTGQSNGQNRGENKGSQQDNNQYGQWAYQPNITAYGVGQNANKDMLDQISRLSQMSEQDRVNELMRTAGSMHSNGTLNTADLERMYQTAGLFMNAEQLKKLRTLIDAIK